MNLTVRRFQATDKSTIGELLIEGVHECYTLEDELRDPGVKVPGQTAIPPGTYAVIIDFSTRFQQPMPHILDVPGFTGIRFHAGNTDADTDGCILLGQTYSTDFVGDSRAAFAAFFAKLEAAIAEGETVLVQIVEQAQ